MDFPIIDLLDEDICEVWLMKYLHPHGARCQKCGAGIDDARRFHRLSRSGIQVYRCKRCHTPFSVYSGTVFAGKHLRPSQVVMLLRGVCKGEPTATLAREIGLARQTVLNLRHELQRNAEAHQPQHPLPDPQTETDEMFQNAGEKGRKAR
jgi:transposase-like protein